MRRFLLFTIVLLSSSLAIAAGNAPPQIFKTPDQPPSKMVKTEVERIYDSSAGSPLTGIAPWKDANALMTVVRNKILSLEVNAINNALYLQNYGPDGPYDEVFTAHFSTYCAKSSDNDKALGGNCQSDPVLQYGDIKISSILSGFRVEGDQEGAAKMFLNNLIAPFPTPDYLTNGKLLKDDMSEFDKRKKVAQALSEQAILSVPREALAEMIARRIPVSTSKGSISMMELMEKEAAQRFLNDDWQSKMMKYRNKALADGKPEVAILYETAMMDSYRNWLAYQNYRQMERVEALLSALISLNYQQAKGVASVGATAGSQ